MLCQICYLLYLILCMQLFGEGHALPSLDLLVHIVVCVYIVFAFVCTLVQAMTNNDSFTGALC